VRSLKPALLLVVYFLVALHGCPGLDYLGARDFVSEKSRQEIREQMSEIGAQAAFAIGAFNRKVRLPLVRKTEWVQKPFRVAQTWNLYRDGPGRVHRLEIRIDDTLVYRSASDEYDWLEPQLRSRRTRPMVESTTRKRFSKNWKGLTRYIVRKALEDFPEAQEISLLSLSGRYPRGKMKPRHRIVAAAPDWKPELQ
jgi:hypothetical protein